jgi:hypothetical protein
MHNLDCRVFGRVGIQQNLNRGDAETQRRGGGHEWHEWTRIRKDILSFVTIRAIRGFLPSSSSLRLCGSIHIAAEPSCKKFMN